MNATEPATRRIERSRWGVLSAATAIGVALVGPRAATAADQPGVLDAVVTASDGAKTRLSRRWGKPAVLFYEDRDSLGLNQQAKDDLFRVGKERGLLSAVAVVAVANLEGFNWQPAIFFALQAVKAEEKKVGVPIYVDLTGELTRAPWNLSGKTSTVLVLSAGGEQRFIASGKLSSAQVAAMLATLEAELAAMPGGPGSAVAP